MCYPVCKMYMFYVNNLYRSVKQIFIVVTAIITITVAMIILFAPHVSPPPPQSTHTFEFINAIARCSSMVRWVVGSILHLSFQPMLNDSGMCYPACGVVHIQKHPAANLKE